MHLDQGDEAISLLLRTFPEELEIASVVARKASLACNDMLHSPILSSPTFALHQSKANEFAAQRRCVLMIA